MENRLSAFSYFIVNLLLYIRFPVLNALPWGIHLMDGFLYWFCLLLVTVLTKAYRLSVVCDCFCSLVWLCSCTIVICVCCTLFVSLVMQLFQLLFWFVVHNVVIFSHMNYLVHMWKCNVYYTSSMQALTTSTVKKGGYSSGDVAVQYLYRNTSTDLKVDTESNVCDVITSFT